MLLLLPAPTDAAMIQQLSRIEVALAETFSELADSISHFPSAKTSPHRGESEVDAIRSAAVTNAWRRLIPSVRALRHAAVAGPGQAGFRINAKTEAVHLPPGPCTFAIQ
jgi:hypothetical protein